MTSSNHALALYRAGRHPTALGVLGSGVLVLPAQRFRPDQLLCADWPPLATGALYGAIYALGIALLAAAWLQAQRTLAGRSLRHVLLLGLPVHLVALVGPPFLSQDTLFYAALGRALSAGGRPDLPIDQVLSRLPGGAAFLSVLPDHWRGGISAYGPGFDAFVRAVAVVAGDRLWLHLRLYQAAGFVAALGCATLVGRAAGPGAAALVWFCPLLIIEGSQGAHNDVFLALITAAFVCLTARGRPSIGILILGFGFLIKASAGLLLLLALSATLFTLGAAPAAIALSLALLCGAAIIAALGGLRFTPLAAAIGSADGAFEYCTRSVECLPRVLLRHRLGAPRAAFIVALAFRGAGLLWLFLCAGSAARDRRLLRGAATFLFVYYLYLHGWSQSWYLLPLLPLLPYADPRLRPAMLTLCVTAVAYYALAIPLTCVRSELSVALTDLAEALVVIVPPSVLLFQRLCHGRTTAQ